MLSVQLASSLLGGCGLCQRVSAMSPAEQAQFFSVVAAVFLALASLFLLYRFVRAPLLAGIRVPSCQNGFLGVMIPLHREFHRFSAWRYEVTRQTFDEIRQAQMVQLMEKGMDGVEIEKRLKAPTLLQWSLPLQPSPFVDVLSAPGLKMLLSDSFTSFTKGDVLTDAFEELLGEGIFRVDGDKWRQQRKVASHMFSFSKLSDYMFSVFVGECENLVSFLGAAAQSGEVLDFQQLMFDFTFDSICDIAFGVKMHQLGSKTPHPFCEAFDSLQTLVTARTVTAPMWWKSKRAFGVGNEKTFAAHVRVVDEFIMGIVRDRRKNPAEYQSDDLLSLFLEDAAKRGEELSDEMLRDLVLNFMVAGRDTTATALTWLFYALDQHPSIESTLVAEVQQRLSSSVQPTPESIKNLVQLEAAFMETTRVWPPVPADMKQCVKDVVWPGGCGTKIPKGTVMIYAPTLLHKLPEYYLTTSGLQHWAADCMEFKPQRWLVPDKDADGGLKILQPSAYDFVSFNAGLRLCLGRSMAILEGKLVASAILQQFRIVVQPGFVPQEKVSVTFAMRHGMPVTVQLRQ